MSIFNITDVTVAGAFCHAMDAAWESDRRAARRRLPAPAEDAKPDAAATASPGPVLTILRSALRRIARLPGYSGSRHTDAIRA